MKLEGVTLRANCNNCRHANRDEKRALRALRTMTPASGKPYCPYEGFKEGVCVKFMPYRALVRNAILRAREGLNRQ